VPCECGTIEVKTNHKREKQRALRRSEKTARTGNGMTTSNLNGVKWTDGKAD
jgi:hypothetical protein